MRVDGFPPMPRYDASRYDPSAPVAIVTLRCSSGDGSARGVPLLIDAVELDMLFCAILCQASA